MIINFKDLLHRYYQDRQFDIPMVKTVVDSTTAELERVFETMTITSVCVTAAIEAGLDPMLFEPLNLDEYKPRSLLLFTGADDDWEYRLAGAISDVQLEGSFREGFMRPIYDPDEPPVPHPVIDEMRKKPGDDHWQIICEGEWIDNGPPVRFLEWLNEQNRIYTFTGNREEPVP